MPRLDFSTTPSLDDFQLDIVGFLAILGEASVLANAQVMFLSKWCFLPRLMPAPQALIRTERPERLEPSTGVVVGSHSGNIRQELNHIAHVLHSEGDSMKDYQVQVVYLKENEQIPQVKASLISPVLFLSVLGSVFAAILLGLSIWREDGYSLIATCLLSSLSSLIGLGSKWSLVMADRKGSNVQNVPDSDVVIKYPNGAFLIVKCNEDIARRLYWAPERCTYLINTNAYRAVSLLGTLMLMGGVITLANAQIESQIAWGVAYMILNGAYWVVAALPTRWNWFLKSFTVIDARLKERPSTLVINNFTDPEIKPLQRSATDTRKAGTKRDKKDIDLGHAGKTFTQALWLAIAITGTSRWAKIASIAPNTPEWDEWLQQAEKEAKQTIFIKSATSETGEIGHAVIQVPKWNSQQALGECLSRGKAKQEMTKIEGSEPVQ